MKKKGLLHQSFYKEKKRGLYNSVAYVQEYFGTHELTHLLKDSVNYLLKDGTPPRNPYVSLYRLVCINSVEDSLTSYFNTNSLRPIELHSKSKKNHVQEIRIGQISLFASDEFASQVDPNTIGYLQTIIRNDKLNFSTQFYTAVCGTELLKSKTIKYASYSKNRLVFRNYLQFFVDQKAAAEPFSKIVYNTVQDFLNSKECYFKCLAFEGFYGYYQAEEVWSRTDIALYKTKLLNRLCVYPFEGREVFIKYYRKCNGEYIQIKQKFIPVTNGQIDFQCSQALPLEGFYKGGFLTREGAQFYLKIYMAQSNRKLNDFFLTQSGYWTIWHLHQQNFEELIWSIYFHVMVTRNDQHNILWDAVSSLLCSPISQLNHFLNQLKTLVTLIQLKVDTKEIQNLFGYISLAIRQNLNQGYNAELFLIKDYVVKLCQRCSSSKYFQETKYSKSLQFEHEVLHILSKVISILDASLLHYKQILVGFNQTFKNYMTYLFLEKKSLPIKQFSIVSFAELFQMKNKSQVVIIQEEVNKVMQEFRVSEKQARDIVVINYFQETKLKQNIYSFLLDICFGAKPIYALPILIISFIQFAFEHQYNELVINNIQLHQKVENTKNNKTEEATMEDIRLHSLRGNLKHYNYSFLRIQKYFDLFRIEEKGVNVLYSVSGRFLMEDLTLTNLNQNTLGLDIDVVSKSRLEDALEIFYNIVIKKCKQLEKRKNVGVIGFFNRNLIVKHFDLKSVLTFEQFKSIIGSSESILLKCLVNDTRLKVVELVFNLHYFGEGWNHLKPTDKFWQYNRVFFQKKHLDLWMDLHPQVSSQYHIEADQILNINLSLKKWLIQASKDRREQSYILSYCCQKAYQLGRQAFNFAYLIEYMKIDTTGKFSLNSLKPCVKQHFRSIRKLIKDFAYIYHEGCSITILHYMTLIQDYFSLHKDNNGEENELNWLQSKYTRIGELLNSSSQVVILYYRNYLINKKEQPFTY